MRGLFIIVLVTAGIFFFATGGTAFAQGADTRVGGVIIGVSAALFGVAALVSRSKPEKKPARSER